MTTITLTVCDAAPRESTLRRLALSAGIALVRWAHRRPLPPTHARSSPTSSRRCGWPRSGRLPSRLPAAVMESPS